MSVCERDTKSGMVNSPKGKNERRGESSTPAFKKTLEVRGGVGERRWRVLEKTNQPTRTKKKRGAQSEKRDHWNKMAAEIAGGETKLEKKTHSRDKSIDPNAGVGETGPLRGGKSGGSDGTNTRNVRGCTGCEKSASQGRCKHLPPTLEGKRGKTMGVVSENINRVPRAI